MTLREILRSKGTTVHSIGPDAMLVEVAVRLVEHHCGSLLVCEQRGPRMQVVGIITERDLLRAAAASGGSIAHLRVQDYMTSMLVTAHPNDTLDELMGIMTEHRIRHVPVMEGDQLAGVVSIGAIVKAHHHQMAQENHYLKSYIQS